MKVTQNYQQLLVQITILVTDLVLVLVTDLVLDIISTGTVWSCVKKCRDISTALHLQLSLMFTVNPDWSKHRDDLEYSVSVFCPGHSLTAALR